VARRGRRLVRGCDRLAACAEVSPTTTRGGPHRSSDTGEQPHERSAVAICDGRAHLSLDRGDSIPGLEQAVAAALGEPHVPRTMLLRPSSTR
jgi:hypothetical protein